MTISSAGPEVARIVIVTSDDDYTADMLVGGLGTVPFVRLDPGRCTTKVPVTVTLGSNGHTCAIGGMFITPDTRVWWRKPTMPHEVSGDAAWAADEGISLLEGALLATAGPWINDPSAVAKVRQKFWQLALAIEVGMNVPGTIVTTSPSDATAFAADAPTLVKPTTQRYTDFASPWRIPPGADLSSIENAPCLLQREVHKVADIRVTIIGDQVFAMRITRGGLDWRVRINSAKCRAQRFDKDTSGMVREYCRRAGLVLASIDFAEGEDGTLWLLDVNANPEYGFQEILTGDQLIETTRDWLLGR